MPKPHVLLIHNVVAPYRLPLFEHLSQEITLDVWFCKTKTRDRRWNTSRQGYHFPHHILAAIKLGPFIFNPTLIWHLLRHTYDVYLVGDFPEVAATTFITIAVAKLHHRPVVLWSETTSHEVNYFQRLAVSSRPHHRRLRHGLTVLITRYRRFLLGLVDQHLALSQATLAFLKTEGVPNGIITTGPQIAPLSLLPAATIPKSRSPYATTCTVLYLGYLNPGKGINYLIEAFSRLQDPNLRLIIAGSGPAESALRRQAASDTRIQFPGYIASATDRANYFTWADIFVLPTLADCWGLVINEAMHYGTPVITTTTAGGSELLTTGGGLVIPPADTDALTTALSQLIERPEIRAAMARANRHRTDTTSTHQGIAPILAAIRAAHRSPQP